MALDIKPTRSELINLKRRIKQTQKGYQLLKMKRDGLFHEFRLLLKDLIDVRQELLERYREARRRIAVAAAVEGSLTVRSAAMATLHTPVVEVTRRNIMGVVVPKVEGTAVSGGLAERGVGIIGGSSFLDEAAEGYERVVQLVIRMAEMEATLKRLLKEIESTKRRVNALEFKVIPEMQEAQGFIQLRLEELERESTFRLKRFKKK